MLGQWADRVGVPFPAPADRHGGVSDHGEHFSRGQRREDARAFPGARPDPPDAVDVASLAAIGEVGRLVGVPGTNQPVDLLQGLIPIQLGLPDRRFVAPSLCVDRNGLRRPGLELCQRLVKGTQTLRDQRLAPAVSSLETFVRRCARIGPASIRGTVR